MKKEPRIISDFKIFCNVCLTEQMIDDLSKGLTQYIFRSAGPIEDMHVKGQLSQEDMKTLNKSMVNKLAGIFVMLQQGRLDELDVVLSSGTRASSGWDKAEPDLEIFEVSKELQLNENIQQQK